jgi:hypothetical protein
MFKLHAPATWAPDKETVYLLDKRMCVFWSRSGPRGGAEENLSAAGSSACLSNIVHSKSTRNPSAQILWQALYFQTSGIYIHSPESMLRFKVHKTNDSKFYVT